MPFEINQREREGIVVLDLAGDLTIGGGASQLSDRIRELQAAGKVQVALNLEGVPYIDSTGLGTLVFCNTRLAKNKGALRLYNLNKRAAELLILTRLSTVFEVFSGEQDAVNSFFPDRAIQKFDILSFVQQRTS